MRLLLLLLTLPSIISTSIPPSNHLSASAATALQTATPFLTSWRSRVDVGGRPIDAFGAKATKLLQECADTYDGLTTPLLSVDDALLDRRDVKKQTMNSVAAKVRGLFNEQLAIVERETVARFKKDMLRAFKVDRNTGVQLPVAEGDEPMAICERAMARFTLESESLEVAALGLTTGPTKLQVEASLAAIMDNFADSPAAKIKAMSAVKKSASKPKPPNERGIVPTVHMVAMIRPDGFGNLSGFGSYQIPGGHSVTVGVANDADSPEVLNQFGGLRPPLIRVQPKLQLDVDL